MTRTSACTPRAMRLQEAHTPTRVIPGSQQFTSCASATAAVPLADPFGPPRKSGFGQVPRVTARDRSSSRWRCPVEIAKRHTDSASYHAGKGLPPRASSLRLVLLVVFLVLFFVGLLVVPLAEQFSPEPLFLRASSSFTSAPSPWGRRRELPWVVRGESLRADSADPASPADSGGWLVVATSEHTGESVQERDGGVQGTDRCRLRALDEVSV